MNQGLSNLEWFEKTKQYGSKPGLGPIRQLLNTMGNPQDSFDSIQVTGTNGKGSTTAITASILDAAGYNVGMFTSPHLSRVTECIRVNGEEISGKTMDRCLGEIKNKIGSLTKQGTRHPTYFEILVALAYKYFQEENVQVAVIEVGMGGKLDATNVINNKVSIVTNISLEHTQWLGETLEEIAENKVGILRPRSVLITAETKPRIVSLLQKKAVETQSKFIQIDNDYLVTLETSTLEGQVFTLKTHKRLMKNLTIPLPGLHQLRNAICAIAAVESLETEYELTQEDIREGLTTVSWPGRFEIIEKEPTIILDGAKDAEAVEALVDTIKNFYPKKEIITILGISSDKTHDEMIKNLAEITHQFIITEHRIKDRTTRAKDLEKFASTTGIPTRIIKPVNRAIEYAKENSTQGQLILITGSVFLIGEAREYWVS